jgi:hypothetical protein
VPPRKVALGEQRLAVLTEAANIRAGQRACIRAEYRTEPHPDMIARAEALEATARVLKWILLTKDVVDLLKEADLLKEEYQ